MTVAMLGTIAGAAPLTDVRPAVAAVPIGPERLLARFAALEGLEASYREEKSMALLSQPLVSEGTLHYARPGRLARRQKTPSLATVVIVDDELRFGDEHGSERVDMRKNPIVRSFVDSFLGVLAGDERALTRSYRVDFAAGSGDGWTMKLVPKLAPMNKMIERVELRGRDVVLDEMIVVEIGGDTTTTVFRDVNPARRYTPAERDRIFRLP